MKKETKTDYWLLLFILIPGILYGKIADVLNDENIAYSVAFTIVGVSIGYLLHFLTKKKTIIIKLISLIVFATVPFIAMIISNQQNNLVNKEWINQKIDSNEFSSPYQLNLISSKIPDELKAYYNKIEVYSDGKNDKSTTVYSIKLKEANIDIKEYFSQYFNSIKSKIPSLESGGIISQKETNNELLTEFKFILENKSINGFCRIIKTDDEINMFWLIPLSDGFSKEYIDRFNLSIQKQ